MRLSLATVWLPPWSCCPEERWEGSNRLAGGRWPPRQWLPSPALSGAGSTGLPRSRAALSAFVPKFGTGRLPCDYQTLGRIGHAVKNTETAASVTSIRPEGAALFSGVSNSSSAIHLMTQDNLNLFLMKKLLSAVVALTLSLSLLPAGAQPGGRRGGGGGGGMSTGPSLSGAMAKVFGEHTSFSAVLETQITDKSGETMSMPGKMASLDKKSRFEMDMTQMKGGKMSPEAAAQTKAMGMGQIITISRPDKNVTYMIYPDLQAYAEIPLQDPDAGKPESDYKVEVTELGKETLDGHPCVKNKVVVTGKDNRTNEFTVWNATDLKKFPVKVQSADRGNTVAMLFKNIKLSKPDAGLFEPQASFTKYPSMSALMQAEVMKRMGGAMGMPPGGR
jgi:hypothetical protein